MPTLTLPTTRRLWVDHGGRLLCDRHVGYQLHHAIAARPRAVRHRTDLGVWELLTAAEVSYLADEGVGCEGCAEGLVER